MKTASVKEIAVIIGVAVSYPPVFASTGDQVPEKPRIEDQLLADYIETVIDRIIDLERLLSSQPNCGGSCG